MNSCFSAYSQIIYLVFRWHDKNSTDQCLRVNLRFGILSFILNLGDNGQNARVITEPLRFIPNTFHYDHIVCNDKNFDLCLAMKFNCNGNGVKKLANLKKVSKCSFKGEDIFVSSENCLNGIDQENWNLEVYS